MSSFPPWPDVELPGFAAFLKELDPRGRKGSWGLGGAGTREAQPSLPRRREVISSWRGLTFYKVLGTFGFLFPSQMYPEQL